MQELPPSIVKCYIQTIIEAFDQFGLTHNEAKETFGEDLAVRILLLRNDLINYLRKGRK